MSIYHSAGKAIAGVVRTKAPSRFETVNSVIQEELAKPYKYGDADCFLLGCRVADALDPSRSMTEAYVGKYKTQKGAQRLMVKGGHKTLSDVLSVYLERCAPAQARMGDLAVVSHEGVEHVAICVTNTRYLGKTETGKTWFALGDVVAAFRT